MKTTISIQRPEIWAFALAIILANLTLFAGKVCEPLIFFPAPTFSGEWWRALTFPLVHVSWYHLLMDACAFIFLVQGLQENALARRLFYVVACAAGSLGLPLLTGSLETGLCGLSGIAHGLMAIAGLEMMQSKDLALRKIGLICLVLTLIKSMVEALSGQVAFGFLHLGSVGSPVATSHLGGVIGGVFAFGLGPMNKLISRQRKRITYR